MHCWRLNVCQVFDIAMDQLQYQWTGLHHIQFGPAEANVVGMNGDFHRRINDSWTATAEAQILGDLVEDIFINNIAYGPLQKAVWLHAVEDAATDLSLFWAPAVNYCTACGPPFA